MLKNFLPEYKVLRGFAMIGLLLLSTLQAWSQCSQPSNLNANVLAGGTVSLTWSAAGGALNYVVQYRLGSTGTWTNGGTVTTTNQVIAGLLPERVYTWRVRANCSTFSSVATFTTGGNTGNNTACSQPSNLDALISVPGSATLSWSAVPESFYYTLQYRATGAIAWTTAGSVPGTSLSISGLVVGIEYQWRVKASCSVYSSVAAFNSGGSGGNTTCSQPSNTGATSVTTSSAVLNWSGVQEALDYNVQYRRGLSGTWLNAGTTTGTSLTLSGLLANTEYQWRVKASCSDYSSEAVFTTLSSSTGGGTGTGGGSTSCSAPSNTNTLLVTSTSANVEWEPQGGALNYTLQYRLELGSTYTTLGTFTGSTATITGLQPGVKYVWRVKANCSPYGSDNQFETPFSANFSTPAAARPGTLISNNTLLRIFPNPANSDVVQIANNANGAQLLVMNSAGQILANTILSESLHTLAITNWSNGLYIVRIQHSDGRSETSKLVVNH
jgi:Secretion system C-terminal sorting domain/Fibronectin type III domain